MSNDDDFNSEEQEKLKSFEAGFEIAFTASDGTLADWAFLWRELVAVGEPGDSPVGPAINNIEQVACAVLETYIEVFDDQCSPEQARTWARSPETLDDALEMFPLESEDKESVFSIVMTAVAMLVYTQRLREEIDAGNTEHAVWAMRQATLMASELFHLSDSGRAKLRLAALKKAAAKKREEHRRWSAESVKVVRKHPGWTAMQVAVEVNERFKHPCTDKNMRRVLRKLEPGSRPSST